MTSNELIFSKNVLKLSTDFFTANHIGSKNYHGYIFWRVGLILFLLINWFEEENPTLFNHTTEGEKKRR